MFAKLISVEFLPLIFISLVLQTPALKPFNKKKEIKPEKVKSDNSHFIFVFSNFCIAETMSIAYYFARNVRMMYVSLIVHYPFQVLDKIFR